jgi:SAM-dependent methyltransferase
MSYFTMGYKLPRFLSKPLFGDRKRFGLVVQPEDPCWIEWHKQYQEFYFETQKKSIGNSVNNAGYTVLRRVSLDGKKVLEVGPGRIGHIDCWNGSPDEYVIADVRQDMLDESQQALKIAKVRHSTRLIAERFPSLPFDDETFDIVVSFYSMEHLYPLDEYLTEIQRVLRPGGKLVGAIPCEGGLAWGLGRYLTSRRWFLNNTSINPDKIICWEHPNFADHILSSSDQLFRRKFIHFWPLIVPSVDLNLVVQFVYEKQ